MEGQLEFIYYATETRTYDIYKHSPGIHQQSMNHSEPYDFSNTRTQLPHLAYYLSSSFQCKAFVSHDSNLHAVHPIKRQAIPTKK